MALDSRFVIASDLQSLFRDKDTGLPLSNGVIYFYKDQARSEPKDVYKLSGSPPNYTYTNIGSSVNLTAAGTMSDNEIPANDIILYYFPLDGTPDDTNNTAELYYASVYSEGGSSEGVLQFTREAWPNVATSESDSQNLTNYIPNGQFKIHSNVEVDPADTTAVPGQISQAVTNLAQGGWTFERPIGSTATDIILFKTFGGYVDNPTASPTYYTQIENTSPGAGDDFKDLRIKFDDVNKFASNTKKYTYAFWGQSNVGNIAASLILIKNYGTGGDPQEEIPIANFTITDSFAVVQTPNGFVFGDNSGKTIGAQGDDYVQLALRLPTGSLFSVNVINFILTPNSVVVTEFPQTTDEEFASQAITPDIPAYNNNNLYLPVRLGPQGLIYDSSEVGEVIAESNLSVYVNSLHPYTNKMLGNGSQYETAGFSPIGIPYSRLQSVYWLASLGVPIYGTGTSYFIAILEAAANQFVLTNNSPGIVTATADGATPTGFTFTTVHTAIAHASGYFCKAFQHKTNGFLIINNEPGTVGAPSAGTAPVTVAEDRVGQSDFPAIVGIDFTGPVGPSEYFEFQTSNGGVVSYYVWYKVSGTGVDPAIGGKTGILVDVNSGDPVIIVTQKTAMAINNSQATAINTVAASAIPASAFFTATAISPGGTPNNYYIWYKKDGVGTDPSPANRVGIEVDIASSDTDVQVAQETQIAINMKFFGVPDFRGQFLRGWDNGAGVDPNSATRFSSVLGYLGDMIGTRELDEIIYHTHDYTKVTTGTDEIALGSDTSIVFTTDPTSAQPSPGAESRPINIYVNYAIRY